MAGLIDGGQVKLYCVGSYDAQSWSNKGIPLEERARRHEAYESWIVNQVVPWIFDDCGGLVDIVTTGSSLGAYHAANFALKRADLFPRALCMSGNYDPTTWHGWGERGEALYFNNPLWCADKGCGKTPRVLWPARRRLRDCLLTRASRTRWTCGATT